jgi:hypothetical protein
VLNENLRLALALGQETPRTKGSRRLGKDADDRIIDLAVPG